MKNTKHMFWRGWQKAEMNEYRVSKKKGRYTIRYTYELLERIRKSRHNEEYTNDVSDIS